MRVIIGADHRGFPMKTHLTTWLRARGYVVDDVGARTLDPVDDYPEFGAAVGRAIAGDPNARGIVICGGGTGVAVAANKIPGIRTVAATDPAIVRSARNDDDANVLALASDHTPVDFAEVLAATFLETPFAGEKRFRRRIEQLHALEHRPSTR